MSTIHVVREAGGLGDIIRIFAVLDGLREQSPDSTLVYHGPEEYMPLVMNHCAAMYGIDGPARYEATDGLRLRSHRGAALKPPPDWAGDRIVDLFCPAWEHERRTLGKPRIERTALWCSAAGVPVRQPRLALTAWDIMRGRLAITAEMIGIHAKSAALLRMWPSDKWREVEAILLGLGRIPLWIDDSPDYLRAALGDLSKRHTIIGRSFAEVAGIVKALPVVLCVDSAIFHVAGAVGTPALGLFGSTGGELISSIYPTAAYLQGPRVYDCDGPCYGLNERGCMGWPCLDGCRNMAALRVSDVIPKLLEVEAHHAIRAAQ